MLKAQPHLTNSLPYTTAVIKKKKRCGFFPRQVPVARANPMLIWLTTKTTDVQQKMLLYSQSMPNCIAHPPTEANQTIFSRNAGWWNPAIKISPIKNSFRAFEIRPRNCVAQNFVMTELKIILVCVVRLFDFQPAFEKWDRLYPSKGLQTYRGERMYQIEEGAAHPVDQHPCRVSVCGNLKPIIKSLTGKAFSIDATSYVQQKWRVSGAFD